MLENIFKNKSLYFCFFILIVFSNSSYSDNSELVYIQPVSNIKSGMISNGTTLFYGRIFYDEEHSGFLIKSMRNGDVGFFLKGNSGNKIKVRIESNGHVFEKVNENEFLINTKSPEVAFSISSDGAQFIKSDSYTVSFSVAPTL